MNEDVLINPNDFKSTEVKIDLSNTTTGTEILDGYKRLGAQGVQGKAEKTTVEIKMTELLDHGFRLEVPAKICSKGHNCLIQVKTLNTTHEISFEASAKVTSVENVGSGVDEIELKIQQIDEESWKQFKLLFNERQNDIEDFFKSVRGY